MQNEIEDNRERVRAIAAEFAERGDPLGWFEAIYQRSEGNKEMIPWADLETNRFFKTWAESKGLKGNGRTALVVGCGLGDDARYLHDLGFKVMAFDISPTAIEWARRLHCDTDIVFETCDLFQAPQEWLKAFEFALEIYTIQPLPLKMRPQVIEAIARFVAPRGELLVVTRGRGDDEEPTELPWALSRRDLSGFEANGLKQIGLTEMLGDEDEPITRFVVEYRREE